MPMVGALIATMGAGAAEAWYIGRLGSHELAAVSFTFPVVMVLVNLAIGFSAGTSSAIARVVGSRDPVRTQRLTTDALLLSGLVFTALSLAAIAALGPIFAALGATPDLMDVIRPYMALWLGGFVLYAVPIIAFACVRATGDARTPSLLMTVAAIVTIALDPVFIFGFGSVPALGLPGAAIANLIVRVATFATSIVLLRQRRLVAGRVLPSRRQFAESSRAILHVGFPAAGTNVVIPLSSAVLTAMVAGHGTAAVAGYGLATRIESVALVLYFALSGVINPFVGQNLGARRFERIARAINGSVAFSLAFGVFAALALGLLAPWMASLFSRDPAVLDVATRYLRVVPISYGAAGVVMIINACFNALARPLPAVVISILRVGVVCLPLAWFGNRVAGLTGIFAALVVSNIAVGTLAFLWNRTVRSTLAAEG